MIISVKQFKSIVNYELFHHQGEEQDKDFLSFHSSLPLWEVSRSRCSITAKGNMKTVQSLKERSSVCTGDISLSRKSKELADKLS